MVEEKWKEKETKIAIQNNSLRAHLSKMLINVTA